MAYLAPRYFARRYFSRRYFSGVVAIGTAMAATVSFSVFEGEISVESLFLTKKKLEPIE
mgnify:CR=1 FL=1